MVWCQCILWNRSYHLPTYFICCSRSRNRNWSRAPRVQVHFQTIQCTVPHGYTLAHICIRPTETYGRLMCAPAHGITLLFLMLLFATEISFTALLLYHFNSTYIILLYLHVRQKDENTPCAVRGMKCLYVCVMHLNTFHFAHLSIGQKMCFGHVCAWVKRLLWNLLEQFNLEILMRMSVFHCILSLYRVRSLSYPSPKCVLCAKIKIRPEVVT